MFAWETTTGLLDAPRTSLVTLAGRMREIDDDSRLVHLGDNGFAERRQPVMHRGFCLYVADLIDVIVHQRDRAHAVAKGLMHPIELIFDEIASFNAAEYRAGLVASMRGLDIDGSQSRMSASPASSAFSSPICRR